MSATILACLLERALTSTLSERTYRTTDALAVMMMFDPTGASRKLTTVIAKPAGNYGLMDQQFALKWVRQNIGAFGGHSRKLTIFRRIGWGNQRLLQHRVGSTSAISGWAF
jgi:Carboxylesterase family